jgi:dipeptidyl aminopeptidase/acylaminoacyl peptidase
MTAQQQEFVRIDSDFRSHGTRCSAWLYLPKGVTSPPIVIMAHGFAAERTFGLPPFAERFARAGMAVLLFDYRCFGDSDGQPRNLVNPFRHVQDWKAAITHVRALPGVDHNRIALWGTSFSGGHVVVAASRDPGIAAIVSQLPIMDSIPLFTRLGPREMVRASTAASRDVLRKLTLRSPYYIPALGDPGTMACITTPGAKAGYFSMIPEGSTWKNECPARIGFTLALYRPITTARGVKCPALIIMGEKDSLHPPAPIEKAASTMSRAEFIKLPVGPFDPYAGEWFEKTVELETRFLKKHLIEAR